MAYTTRFSGEIRIDPPIPYEDIKGSGFFHEGYNTSSRDVRLKVVEVPIDSVPGAYRREAVAIVGLEGGFSCYDAVPHVQEIVDRWGAGRTFTGRLDAAGEESGDVWRLLVRDGRAVEIRPQLVWPDEAEG